MAKPKKGVIPPQLRGHQFKKGHGKKANPKGMPAGLAKHLKKKSGKK